ncbi:MAG TPA: hypothetical protein VJZ69_03355 [Clostridia bacterium]|nr:hypothetical protein [Clostridia bacterium]
MKCDYCGNKEGILEYKKFSGSFSAEFYFCPDCYKKLTQSGVDPLEAMLELEENRGKVCGTCGCTLEDFKNSYMFGCPDCYNDMRELATRAIVSVQRATQHKGKTVR